MRVFYPTYQVDADLMSRAAPTARFMHCLPASRGEEVTDEVLDGPQSVALPEAGNRLTAMRALLVYFLRPETPNPIKVAAARTDLERLLGTVLR